MHIFLNYIFFYSHCLLLLSMDYAEGENKLIIIYYFYQCLFSIELQLLMHFLSAHFPNNKKY